LESNLNRDPMNGSERRAVTALAAVFGLRMFGLFLVLPVMALYASALDGATPLMVGMALFGNKIDGILQSIFDSFKSDGEQSDAEAAANVEAMSSGGDVEYSGGKEMM